MSMTLSEMAAEAAQQLRTHDSSTMLETLTNGIRRRYARICRMFPWPELNRTISVTVAAGEQSVGIPSKAITVRSVSNETLGCPMEHYSPEMLDHQMHQDYGTAGALVNYTNEGHLGVHTQPSADDELISILGVNAGAIGTCRITGFLSTNTGFGGINYRGVPFAKEATLNGTSSVPILSVVSDAGPVFIETFAKDQDTLFASSTAVSFVRLIGDSTGDLSAISERERTAKYVWLRFGNAADVATTLRCNCRLQPSHLVDDLDVPALMDIDDILIEGALADGYKAHQQMQKASFQENLFEKLVRDYLEQRTEDAPPIRGMGTMHQYRDGSW